ncbi:MAG: glycosyltransferase family 39 protein [Candidatus Omnitrophica bacterium]|nr:glycosyltransferase family 39 protein [Candidatus Omnitrophota bacterium]
MNFTAGLFVMAVLGFFLLCFPTEITSDGARYLEGARLIHQGLGFSAYSLISEEVIPQIDYQPFLSLAIAWVMNLTGWNEIYSLRLVNFLALLGYYLSFYGLIVMIFREKLFQIMASVLVLVSPASWRYFNTALSEPLFMAFLGFSMVGCLKAVQCDQRGERRFWFFVTGVAVLFLCLTRYSGLFTAGSSAAFFLWARRRGKDRKISLEISLFLLPVVLGMGGWLARNQWLGGHLTFLEVFPSRPFFEDFLKVEADFIRNAVEFIVGFSTYRWTLQDLAFIPAFLFLSIGALSAVALWRMRQRPWAHQTQLDFLRLSLLTVALHFLALNFFRLKNGFGETPRYFTILCPIVFLSVLIVIDRLTGAQNHLAGFKRWRSAPVVGLLGFLVLSLFFHSLNNLKSIRETVLARPSPVEGASFSAFENSPWVFKLAGTEIKNHDIVASNNPTFLSYVWARPCRITNRVSGEMVLADIQGTSREGYLILDKEIPCFTSRKFDWKEYLGNLKYEVVEEDPFTLAVRLVK